MLFMLRGTTTGNKRWNTVDVKGKYLTMKLIYSTQLTSIGKDTLTETLPNP